MACLEHELAAVVRAAERSRWRRLRLLSRCLPARARALPRLAAVALLTVLVASPPAAPGAALLVGASALRSRAPVGCRGRGRVWRGAREEGVDYSRFTVQELRAQLKERGLVRKGRKEDLVQRLLRDDAGELGAGEAQAVGGVASSTVAGRAVSPLRPGDLVYLRAHTGRHLEVERDDVRARWDDHGDWQTFSLEKSPLVIDDSDANTFHSGDMVFLRAHTGSFVDVDGEDVRARWADQNHGMKWQGLVIVKHSSGAIVPGDTVFFQTGTGTYLDVQGDEVRARWEDEGEWQALVLEKP